MLCRAAEHQLTRLGPLERELQVVLPREPHRAVQLQAVPEYQRLALPAEALAIAAANLRRGSSAAIVNAAK